MRERSCLKMRPAFMLKRVAHWLGPFVVGVICTALLNSALSLHERSGRPRAVLRADATSEAALPLSSVQHRERLSAAQSDTSIHVAIAFCAEHAINNVENGLTIVRSILMARERSSAARRRRYVFHVIANSLVLRAWQRGWLNYSNPVVDPDLEASAATFSNRWGDVLLYAEQSLGMVELRTYLWTDLHAAVAERLGPDAALIDNNAFKICASVRLLIPFGVAPDADRVLYIDNDSIVSCDLTELYDSAAHWLPDQIIGAVPEGPHDRQPTHYTGMSAAEKRPTAAAFPTGLNSGVLLMHVGRLRQPEALRAYWSAVTGSVSAGLYAAPRLGSWKGTVYFDQDILNIMAFDHPEWFVRLNEAYNWRTCMDEMLIFAAPGWQPPLPCIDHFSSRAMHIDEGCWQKRAWLWKYVDEAMDVRPARPKWISEETSIPLEPRWFPPPLPEQPG